MRSTGNKTNSKPSVAASGARTLDKPSDVAEFREAARAYLKEHGKSKEAANAALKAIGYLTRTGRIAKPYR